MKTPNSKLKSVTFPFICSILLLSITSCGARVADANSQLHDASNDASDAASSSAATLDLVQNSLGQGFDSKGNVLRSVCIESSDFVYRGSNYADLSYLRDFSYNELLDEMGLGIFAKLNLFGLVTAKVSGDITSTLSKTEDSSAFIVKSDIVGKSVVLKQPTLTPIGLSAYQTKDPIHFREICGDQFVEQVQLGAQLFIGVKYYFTSKEDKEKLQVQLKGSALWGLIKFSKTWSKEERELLKNVRVKINSYQIGGDSKKLELLKNSIEKDSCSAEDIEKCAASLDLLMDYATKDFPGQLNAMNISSESNSGPAVTGVVTIPYDNLMIYNREKDEYLSIDIGPGTTVDNAFEPAMDRLARLKSNLNLDIQRRETLSEFNLSANDKALIEVGRREVENLLLSVNQLAEDTCKPARADIALRATCISKIGELEIKGEKALQPIVLSSRK